MKKEILYRVMRYLHTYRSQLFLTICYALIQVLLFLLVPVLLGEAIDLIVGEGAVAFDAILPPLLWAAGAVCIGGIAQWAMQASARKLSADVARDIRKEAFSRLGKVPMKELDKYKHGDLASRLVNDADALAEGLLQGISQLFPGVVTIFTTLIVMFWLNWVMALVVICATPLSILFAQFVGRRSARYFRCMTKEQGKMSAYASEMMHELLAVQDFGYETQAESLFGKQTKA